MENFRCKYVNASGSCVKVESEANLSAEKLMDFSDKVKELCYALDDKVNVIITIR